MSTWNAAAHPRGGPTNPGRFARAIRSAPADRELDGTSGWPAHRYQTVPWQMSGRGPRDDRMLRDIGVSLPPEIATLDPRTSKSTGLAVVDATSAVASLDSGLGRQLVGLGSFLLRTESVSSSRIEHVNASRNDFAKALAGIKSSSAAKTTFAAVTALESMIRRAGGSGRIALTDMLEAHRLLMKDDWNEKLYAGRVRDVQNWIGGSDYSPRGAIHVPPPTPLVDPLMDDLIRYVNREDIPAIVQAAIAHAQFESIHPFTDGNGRIGRALISATLRRRQLAKRTVVPIASAMLADTSRYFSMVNDYRNGAADEFVHYLAEATSSAAEAAESSAEVLAELPDAWRDQAKPRGGSTAEALIGKLLGHPVVNVSDVMALTGSSYNAANGACDRLTETEVLTPLTQSARDRAWMAADVLDEIDDMNLRVGRCTPP